MKVTYQDLCKYMKEIGHMQSAIALLQWDQEVYMPKKAGKDRAQQVATLSRMSHDQFVDDQLGEMLDQLAEAHPGKSDEGMNIRRIKEDYRREKVLPSNFIERRSAKISEAFQAWMKAREDENFSVFADPFQKLVEIKREEAELRTYEDHPFDALFELYEPGMKTAQLDKIFQNLQSDLSRLLDAIRSQPQVEAFHKKIAVDRDLQWDFGIQLLKDMGYDFEAGRQDIAPHPFTISFAGKDVRVTTRIEEGDIANMIWSCIHEGGHALYEQGLPKEQFPALPLGEATSLSIHESQARLWENHIGRSQAYWDHYYEPMAKNYGAGLENFDSGQFYKAINRVAPNLIRTEADELHYHLHIFIRYELEKQLLDGSLPPGEIEEAWNDLYQKHLGITPNSVKEGVLQDIHWAHGGFGYFPTYTLGSLYAAQFYEQLMIDIPEAESQVKAGKLETIRQWLAENVYHFGRKGYGNDLCLEICGEPLKSDAFLRYAHGKFGRIYNL